MNPLARLHPVAMTVMLCAAPLTLAGCGSHPPPGPVYGDPRAGLSVYKFEGCAQCHAIGGVSVGQTGPALDGEASRRTAAWLRAMLSGHMRAVGAAHLSARDREDLVTYLASLR